MTADPFNPFVIWSQAHDPLAHLQPARSAATRPVVATHDVAFIGPILSSHGGTETWHADLLPRLRSHGLSVAGYGVLDGDPQAPAAARLRAAGLRVAIGADATRQLAATARVVIAWGFAEPRHFAGARQKLVVVSHGDGLSAWSLGVLAKAAPQADRVVVVSEAALRTIPEPQRDAAIVIRNGIDPARLQPSADRETLRSRLGWTSPTLLVCSRLAPEKRLATAVEVFGSLPAEWRLAIAGDGPERDTLREHAARLGVADRIEWLGVRQDVADLYHAADAMIAPGDSEGFGLATAEAILCGLPVVACPVGFLAARPELATVVAADATVDAWASAVRLAREDHQRSQWARRALSVITDPEQAAARWAEVVRSLLPRPAAIPPLMATLALVWGCDRRGPVVSSGCSCKRLCADGRGLRGVVTDVDCFRCVKGQDET